MYWNRQLKHAVNKQTQQLQELSASLERKVEERTRELKESKEKFELTITGSDDGLWQYVPSTDKNWFSPRYYEMLGYENNGIDPTHENWTKHVHPDDLEFVEKALEDHVENDTVYDLTYRMLTKDGEPFWIRDRARTLRDEEGNAISVNGSVTDIRELKEAELALSNEKKFTQTLLDSQEQIIISTDGDKLKTVNKKFYDFFSVDSIKAFNRKYDAQCICETFNNNAPKGYLQPRMGEEQWIDYVISRSDYSDLHKAMITIDGKDFIFSVTATNLPGGNNARSAVFTDITEMENSKTEIEHLYKHTQASIEYASLIQGAVIPDDAVFNHYFQDHFVIWEPKDTVGGDIYLFEELRNSDECLLMVIDCTGHGVSGALVTMLVKAIERQVVGRLNGDINIDVSPGWILSYFNRTMKSLLKQHNKSSASNAGFDGGVIYYNKKEQILKFAGAQIPLFYLEGEELKTIKGDHHSIGYKTSDIDYEFTDHIIPTKGDMSFYLTTDGYIDQLGGEKEFSFGKSHLTQLIKTYAQEKMEDQRTYFLNALREYQGEYERNDDVTMVAFRVHNK